MNKFISVELPGKIEAFLNVDNIFSVQDDGDGEGLTTITTVTYKSITVHEPVDSVMSKINAIY